MVRKYKEEKGLSAGSKKFFMASAAFGLLAVSLAGPAIAGITVAKDAEKGSYVKMGGRVQFQYHLVDPDGGQSTDEVRFRRFRPYIEGGFAENWQGKFQFDLGKAKGDNEIAIKDAYFQYKADSLKITVGNANFPFSREFLTTSKKQQLVERTFVGDHNYGTPDRQAGIHLTGHLAEDSMITWGASLVQAGLDPDDDKLDFDTVVNRNDDFNEGWMLGGRVDFHPLGKLKMAQGDFKGKPKATIGLAAYTWANDDDNNTRTTGGLADDTGKPDVDNVTGLEISAALRGWGMSVDAQYNLFSADTIDPTVSSGIYRNGSTDLESIALEGGYMVWPKHLELVAGYEIQDADGYADKWTRLSFGANYFIHKHNAKVQLTYRMGENLKGKLNNDEDEVFLQAQYVF